MDNFRRTAATVLFPIAVFAITLLFWSFWYQSPVNSVTIDVSFGRNSANITEIWYFWGRDIQSITRSFPQSKEFSNMTFRSVSCQGRATVSEGPYDVACEGDFSENAVLLVRYTLHDPYSCYEDMCYFEGRFFDGIHVNPLEFHVSGATEFETFPEVHFTGSEGIFLGDVSSAYLFASLPSHYSGKKYSGNFQKRFETIEEKYVEETALEKGWGTALLKVIALETLAAFLLFLLLGVEREVKVARYSTHPPSLKAPHELACLFFPDIPRENVISATVIRLASRGRLLITRENLRIVSLEAGNPFEHRVLWFLSKVARKGTIRLDSKWISDRVREIGEDEYRALLREVYRFAGCPREMSKKVQIQFGDWLVLSMQAAFIVMSLAMFVMAPVYLANYKASLFLLLVINFFWLLFAWKFGYRTFSKYTHHAAVEKAMWLAYGRFARSKTMLQSTLGVDWSYLLVFATLFGFPNRIIRLAEHKRAHFLGIFDPRLAVRTFEMLSRAAHRT